MKSQVERVEEILRAIVHECQVERITFMAGSIAYNAFVSLLPLLFLLLAVVSAVGNAQFESNMIALIQSAVTPGAGEVLVTELRQASVGGSAIGVAALVWGMLRIFRSLDTAFSNIYETGSENTFTDQLTDGIIVFASVAAVIVVVVVLETTVSVSAASGTAWLAHRLLLIVTVALALVPIYYLFPDESGMSIAETLPGVFFTASALVVFQSVFWIYVQYSSQTAENSLLASMLVFLTWLYFSGLVLLVGVVINAVLSNRSEDINIRPVIGGVPKSETVAESEQLVVPDETLHQLRHSAAESERLTVPIRASSAGLALFDEGSR